MARLSSTLVGAIAFFTFFQSALAIPPFWQAVALLVGVFGGIGAGTACSVAHCKRDTATAAATTLAYLDGIGDCFKALHTQGLPTTDKIDGKFIVSGVPKECIAATRKWDGVPELDSFSGYYGGSTKILDEATVEVTIPWVVQKMMRI